MRSAPKTRPDRPARRATRALAGRSATRPAPSIDRPTSTARDTSQVASNSETRTPTVREIAAAAGVSVATVSRTLQRPEMVSEQTRARINEVSRRLGYTPNALARNLRTARTQLVIAL